MSIVTVTQPSSLLTRRHPAASGQPSYPSLDEKVVDVLVKLEEGSPLSTQLRTMTKEVGLRDVELAELAKVSRATLARWRKEGDAERPPALDNLRAVVVLLIGTGAMRPRSVAGWLRSRNNGLDWRRPLEVLQAGDQNFPLVMAAAEAACGGRMPVEKIPDMGAAGAPGPSAESPAAGPD